MVFGVRYTGWLYVLDRKNVARHWDSRLPVPLSVRVSFFVSSYHQFGQTGGSYKESQDRVGK